MNLPKIDVSTLPDLDALTGVFGSAYDSVRHMASNDSIIIMMTFLYDIAPSK